MINAANQPSVLDLGTIRCRNNQVDRQLLVNMLRSVSVEGDGNCFFRALSVDIHGHEKDHINLRHTAAKFIASQASSKSPEDCVALRQHAANVMRSGTWLWPIACNGKLASLCTSNLKASRSRYTLHHWALS